MVAAPFAHVQTEFAYGSGVVELGLSGFLGSPHACYRHFEISVISLVNSTRTKPTALMPPAPVLSGIVFGFGGGHTSGFLLKDCPSSFAHSLGGLAQTIPCVLFPRSPSPLKRRTESPRRSLSPGLSCDRLSWWGNRGGGRTLPPFTISLSAPTSAQDLISGTTPPSGRSFPHRFRISRDSCRLVAHGFSCHISFSFIIA